SSDHHSVVMAHNMVMAPSDHSSQRALAYPSATRSPTRSHRDVHLGARRRSADVPEASLSGDRATQVRNDLICRQGTVVDPDLVDRATEPFPEDGVAPDAQGSARCADLAAAADGGHL